MAIWKTAINLDELNKMSRNTLVEHLNIIYCDITDNSLSATMPVCSFTHQPMKILHGGASVVLAETIGSVAANYCVSHDYYCVGLDINANHIRTVREGVVMGTATPIHIGVTTQVWQINITDERKRLVCSSRLTMAVRKKKANRE